MAIRCRTFHRLASNATGHLNFLAQKKKIMKALMIVLSIALAYPVFMLFVYLVAKMIFTPLDRLAAEQQRERFELMMKARRVRKIERRMMHA
jgi:hypothetical protein